MLSEQGQDLAGFGMPAQRLLGEEQLAIGPEVEDPAGAGDEGEGFDHVLVITQNICRRTDGSVEVVSRYAVFEAEAVFFVHDDLWERV